MWAPLWGIPTGWAGYYRGTLGVFLGVLGDGMEIVVLRPDVTDVDDFFKNIFVDTIGNRVYATIASRES